MLQHGKLFYYVILVESFILAILSIIAGVWLVMGEIGSRMTCLRGMIKFVFILSLVIIPIESHLFRLCQKHNPRCGLSHQNNFFKFIFPKLVYIFGFFWLLHAVLFLLLANKLQLRQGTDSYMFYLRPGSIIIFVSAIGMEIVNYTIGHQKNS